MIRYAAAVSQAAREASTRSTGSGMYPTSLTAEVRPSSDR